MASESGPHSTPLGQHAAFRRPSGLSGGRVGEVDGRSLHREHAGDEPLVVAEGESDLKPLQELQVLGKVLAGEATTVMEDECYIGLFQDPVVDKVLSLRDSDHLREEVSQPHWVDEVEVVEPSQVVIVVKENSVVMEKLGSYICIYIWRRGQGSNWAWRCVCVCT